MTYNVFSETLNPTHSLTQPLEGRSSPYCKDMWRRYCCVTSFFPIVDKCLSCADSARQSCVMVHRWRFLRHFCILHFQRAAFSTFQICIRTKATPCVEVWLTFTLRPLRYRQGKNKKERKIEERRNHRAKI